ncbi:hypothetical protein DL764_002967 [Monosporascus ibericus]|uniref:Uncharacterized protein n=1 Tax=Monosporascus ibericus TaxID=155417 RepID=A0A4Q4TMI0_9PEZI|nr:hypothetical protein DL764_002967 [Monosporascus ibericus]
MSTNPVAQEPSALAAAAAAAANTTPAGQWKQELMAFLMKTVTAALGSILAALGSCVVGCLLDAFSMGAYWRGLLEDARVEAAYREGRREGFEVG